MAGDDNDYMLHVEDDNDIPGTIIEEVQPLFFNVELGSFCTLRFEQPILRVDEKPIFVVWNIERREIVTEEEIPIRGLHQPNPHRLQVLHPRLMTFIAPRQSPNFMNRHIYNKGNELRVCTIRSESGRLSDNSLPITYNVPADRLNGLRYVQEDLERIANSYIAQGHIRVYRGGRRVWHMNR